MGSKFLPNVKIISPEKGYGVLPKRSNNFLKFPPGQVNLLATEGAGGRQTPRPKLYPGGRLNFYLGASNPKKGPFLHGLVKPQPPQGKVAKSQNPPKVKIFSLDGVLKGGKTMNFLSKHPGAPPRGGFPRGFAGD